MAVLIDHGELFRARRGSVPPLSAVLWPSDSRRLTIRSCSLMRAQPSSKRRRPFRSAGAPPRLSSLPPRTARADAQLLKVLGFGHRKSITSCNPSCVERCPSALYRPPLPPTSARPSRSVRHYGRKMSGVLRCSASARVPMLCVRYD